MIKNLLSAALIFTSLSASATNALIDDYWAGFRQTGDYFVDDRDGFSGSYEVDADGVLISIYRDRGAQYNPMFSATYAVSACRDYVRTRDVKYRDTMNVQLSKLLSIASIKKGHTNFAAWTYDYDIETYDLKAPWVSGLAQARIAAAFICAFDATGDESHRENARLAVNAFKVDMKNGGVLTRTPNGVHFEEIAKPGFRSTKVLNGHVSALQVVWLWAQISQEKEFSQLAWDGINSVLHDLPQYDAGFISWYDQDYTQEERHFAPRKDYNNLHVTQLAWLYHASGNPAFLQYALKFSGYEHPRMPFTANHSTNPLTNGPEKIDFLGYSNYWSSNQFPTSIDLDLGAIRSISGIDLWSYSVKAAPRDFDIFGSADATNFTLLYSQKGNDSKRFFAEFPVTNARWLKIVIFSDNGNSNTAISGISFRGAHVQPQAISSRIRMTSAANRFFDSGFEMRANEWLLIDNQNDRSESQFWELTSIPDLKGSKFEWSSDLSSWSSAVATVTDVSDKRLVVKVESKFARYIRFTSPKHGVTSRFLGYSAPIQ